jgi:CO dehydrogenase/acetyl-CoA synthase beta subunit
LEIFDDDIRWLRGYLESRRSQGRDVRLLDSGERDRRIPDFFNKEKTAIVLSEDTWLELGNPKTNSTAPVLVTESLDLVHDGAITLVGPDVPEIRGSLPFAQILLIASDQLQEEDYRKINSFQYELELRGYMIKAIPSSLNLWSRVSEESVGEGFSFEVLGRAIVDRYKSTFNIPSMEVVFVTSSEEDVKELEELRHKVTRILSAMNKMIEELSFDCSSCEYLDVCGDVRQLGALREKVMREKQIADP